MHPDWRSDCELTIDSLSLRAPISAARFQNDGRHGWPYRTLQFQPFLDDRRARLHYGTSLVTLQIGQGIHPPALVNKLLRRV